MAVAKGQAGAVGSMVICAGGVSITVAVDADGQPVGPAHVCPECALAMLDGAIAPGEALLSRSLSASAQNLPIVLVLPAARIAVPWARGPPVLI